MLYLMEANKNGRKKNFGNVGSDGNDCGGDAIAGGIPGPGHGIHITSAPSTPSMWGT